MKVHLTSPRLSGSAGDTQSLYLAWPYAERGRLLKSYLAPDVTSAKDGTDYLTISVKNGTTALMTHLTSDDALTAGTPQEMDLASGVTESCEFDQGDAIKFEVAKAASGKAFGFVVCSEFELIRS